MNAESLKDVIKQDRQWDESSQHERRHQRQANRLIVISPMIDAQAQQVAERLGIETYGDSIEVETL